MSVAPTNCSAFISVVQNIAGFIHAQTHINRINFVVKVEVEAFVDSDQGYVRRTISSFGTSQEFCMSAEVVTRVRNDVNYLSDLFPFVRGCAVLPCDYL